MLFILHSKANRDKESALSQIQCSTITLLAGETSGNLPNKLSFRTNNCMVLEGGGRGYWVKLLQPRVTMGQIFLCDYFPNPSLIFPVFTCLGSIEWAVYRHLWIHSLHIVAWLERLFAHQQCRYLLLSGERYLACQQQLDFIGHFANPHRSLLQSRI